MSTAQRGQLHVSHHIALYPRYMKLAHATVRVSLLQAASSSVVRVSPGKCAWRKVTVGDASTFTTLAAKAQSLEENEENSTSKRSDANPEKQNTTATSINGSDTQAIDETAELPDIKKNPSNTRAILEELFPAESLARDRPVRSDRHIPRLAFQSIPAASQGTSSPQTAKAWAGIGEQSEDGFNALPQEPIKALVVLYRASKSLNETDFHLATPSGKHIAEWKPAGRIQKIIRERNLDTMERTGTYYLVFADVSAAKVYMKHVTEVHSLARSHDATRLPPRIPLVPTANKGKADPARQLESFALYPPVAKLRISLETPPFERVRQVMVERGGYIELLRERQSEHEVLVTLQDYETTVAEILEGIRRDGRELGAAWSLTGAKSGVRHVFYEWRQSDEHDVVLTQAQKRALDDTTWLDLKPRMNQFVVSFADRAEAQRFVIMWHQRDIAHLLEDTPSASVLATAELTW